MNKRILSSIFRIGIFKRFHRGLRITIIPSYACNYNCHYCSRKIDGKSPSAPKKSLEDWKRFLIDLDKTFRLSGTKIKEIIFTGGEPSILSYHVELSNWILSKGWFLTYYTNLSKIEGLKEINQSTKLRIHATYHHGYSDNGFIDRWRELDKVHRVDVDEIGKRRIKGHKKTYLKPFSTDEELENKLATLRVDPNFAIYLYCWSDVRANLKN